MSGDSFYVVEELRQEVASFVEQVLREAPEPLLYWFEPRVGPLPGYGWLKPGERKYFGAGRPERIYPFDEARIFWNDRALYVISKEPESGLIMEYGEGEPRLLKGEQPKRDWKRAPPADQPRVLFWQQGKDQERFGLEAESLAGIDGVRVVRYLAENGTLIAWRLVRG